VGDLTERALARVRDEIDLRTSPEEVTFSLPDDSSRLAIRTVTA
jgi:hypothetical protein